MMYIAGDTQPLHANIVRREREKLGVTDSVFGITTNVKVYQVRKINELFTYSTNLPYKYFYPGYYHHFITFCIVKLSTYASQ